MGDLRQALRDTSHNGFPVVRDTPQGQVGSGLCCRYRYSVCALTECTAYLHERSRAVIKLPLELYQARVDESVKVALPDIVDALSPTSLLVSRA